MSEPLDLWFWGRLFAILIAGTGGLALVAKVITRSVGDPYLNRAIWRFCIAGFMAVTLYVLFGVKLSFPEERRVPIVQEELQPQEASQTATIKTLSIAPRTVTPREVEPNILWPLGMWVVGSVLFLCRIFYGVSKLTLLKGRELQQGIIATNQITIPISYGLFRPRIAVPGNFEQQFSEAEQKIIIAHERAHLKAGDPWWYLIANIICATFWWNPAAWWAFRNLQDSSELAADATACSSPAESILLADSLIKLAKKTVMFSSGLSVLGKTSNLNHRVKVLVKNECTLLTTHQRNLLKVLLNLSLILICFGSSALTGNTMPISLVYASLQAVDISEKKPMSTPVQMTFSVSYLRWENISDFAAPLLEKEEYRPNIPSRVSSKILLTNLVNYTGDILPVSGDRDLPNVFNYLYGEKILSEAQKNVILDLQRFPSFTVKDIGKVTVRSGDSAHVSHVDMVTVVAERHFNLEKELYEAGQLQCGPMVDILPAMEINDESAKVIYKVRITDFFGYERKEPRVPRIGLVEHTTSVRQKRGETLLLDLLPVPAGADQPNERILLLVTMHIVPPI